MRRRIVAAVLTGAAGVAIGLLPVAGASAATVTGGGGGGGGGNWRCSENWNGRWDECCNRDWRDRPSWCWDEGG
ncbi:hypothetical protein ACWGI5_34210, partial [Streptomyces xanthophaeus]